MPSANQVSAVIIGGGHSGLAMSKCLSDRSVDHIVLERGQVANSWKKERWDSLRLLTPNWQSRLPGFEYDGDNPDGFMDMPEVVDFVERYAQVIDAPVQSETTVTGVRRNDDVYEVDTDQGPWRAQAVVLASGACNISSVPEFASAVPPGITMVTPHQYRNPDQLDDGGVMVVGASATGLQLADEIHRSGRPVTLSVGEHVRMPRTYRGKDIQFWLDAIGRLDERYDEVEDLSRARNIPSPQLVGTPERRSLDLNSLTSMGVRLRGRLGAINDSNALFSGGLRNQCSLADLKMRRLLKMVDEWVEEAGLDANFDPPEEYDSTTVDEDPPLMMKLGSGEIKTILWATGFRADYSWLELPLVDHKGRIRHEGGVVTESDGMYTLGATFLRRRKSSFIHGAGDDANDLSDHLKAHLDR